jgi:hypothetical protein
MKPATHTTKLQFGYKRLAVLMPMLIGLAQIGFAQKEIPIPTEKGTLTLLFNGFAPERSGEAYPKAIYLQVSLRNDTPFKFQSVSFAMYEYDANGNDLWLCGADPLRHIPRRLSHD